MTALILSISIYLSIYALSFSSENGSKKNNPNGVFKARLINIYRSQKYFSALYKNSHADHIKFIMDYIY